MMLCRETVPRGDDYRREREAVQSHRLPREYSPCSVSCRVCSDGPQFLPAKLRGKQNN